jgi:predicted TIM-barrel fold metal-dependent hydrolase
MIRHMTTGYFRELEAFKEQMSDAETRWRNHQLSPVEVWRRQGFAGASFLPKAEADRRTELGVDKIMWGSDYPHVEGTWPNTRMKLARALASVPRDEKALILGENALRCYETAFDEVHLREVAARTGILMAQV